MQEIAKDKCRQKAIAAWRLLPESARPQLLYENEKATNKMGLGYGY
jgi:hypothetical protein